MVYIPYTGSLYFCGFRTVHGQFESQNLQPTKNSTTCTASGVIDSGHEIENHKNEIVRPPSPGDFMILSRPLLQPGFTSATDFISHLLMERLQLFGQPREEGEGEGEGEGGGKDKKQTDQAKQDPGHITGELTPRPGLPRSHQTLHRMVLVKEWVWYVVRLVPLPLSQVAPLR